MTENMTLNEASFILANIDRRVCDDELNEALDMAIKALEIVEEFEKAHIITGGRLNRRTYAYKCGLEDGKRKALEQQPSEDCISRQAVLDNAYAYGNGLEPEGYCVNVEDIQSLPPVKPVACIAEIKFGKEDLQELANEKIKEITAELEERKWIPVGERLPEEEIDVLICNSKGNIEVSQGSVFDDGTWGWYTSGWHFGEVLAWMPMPEPYKAEMSEVEE